MENRLRTRKKKLFVCTAILLLALVLLLAVSGVANNDRVTQQQGFNIGAHRKMVLTFSVYEAGAIVINVRWTGPNKLHLFLYGPGQEDPYVDVREDSPINKRFTATTGIVQRGETWRVEIGNPHNVAAHGNVQLTYPKTVPVIRYFRSDLDPLCEEEGITRYLASPGQHITLSWSVAKAASINLETGCGVVSPELAPGLTPDCPESSLGIGSSQGQREEIIGELGAVFTLKASTDHGSVEAKIRILPQVVVGYQEAVCIGCAPCRNCGRSSEAERIGNILREIEEKLNSGCIRNNTNLDRFNDPYLRDGLTNDILQAMKHLVIYVYSDDLPDIEGRGECETAYGWTPGDKDYVLLCLRKGADGLTLLHELEHYVDPNTTECRAPWVAQWCYGCPQPGLPCPECSE